MGKRFIKGASTAMITIALATMTSISVARADSGTGAQVGCVKRSSQNIAEFNAITDPLVRQGKITKSQQDYARCHPDDVTGGRGGPVALTETIDNAVNVPASAALAAKVKCGSGYLYKDGTRHYQVDVGWISPAYKVYYSLSFCYSKKAKKVADWSGMCSGEVTNFGKVQGWSFEGCTQNDFLPYVLDGSYPGGIHHAMTMHFTNNFSVKTITYDFQENMWGHWNGTCDTKPYGRPVYHYC